MKTISAILFFLGILFNCQVGYSQYTYQLDVRVFLEGPYNGNNMNTDLSADSSLIPDNQPYNNPPWNYAGNESLGVLSSDAVDWVLLEFRDALAASGADTSTILKRIAGLLMNDGTVKAENGWSDISVELNALHSVYLIIWHRNHLGVISSQPMLESGSTLSYDFTDGSNKSYGANSQTSLGNGYYGMIAGDADANGIIDDEDKSANWNFYATKSGYLNSDFNLNMQTDNNDKNDLWEDNLGKECYVPIGYAPPTTNVTFYFKDAAQDTLFDSGTSTLIYRKNGWTADSIKTSTNGEITLQMSVGATYEIQGSHSEDVETFFGADPLYTAFKRPGELEEFEQTAQDDDYAAITILPNDNAVNTYKLHKDFSLIDMRDYASKLNGLQEGTRKFSTADKDAPFWVDTSNGGLGLTATQQEWYNDIITDLESIPHVYLTLPFQEDATQPSDPHVRVNIDEDNPSPGFNSTNHINHEITQANAFYPESFSEYTFKIELFQAIGDLNDIAGVDPAILNNSSQDYTLNTTGRDIFAVMYLFQPGTKF